MKTFSKFFEEIKPPEPQEEDPSVKSKEKRQMQIKKQVLLKKMQAVRAGAGADIVASHTPEGEMVEAKVDQGRSDYGKASIRNYRRSGPGHGEPAMFDPENKRGKLIDKRREEHKARRGVKGAKVPAYKVSEEKKKGLDGKECWDGYKLAGTKKKGGKTVDNCVKEEDKAFEYVKKQIAAKYGKSGYVSKDNPRKPQTDAEKAKVRAHQAKVDKENAAARAKDPSQGRYPKG